MLGSLLSKDQPVSLKDRNYFDLEVTGRDGAVKRYRIHKGRSGNVELLAPDGTPLRRYCAHPDLYVPDEDTMLSQKLVLESDEERFLRTANVHPVLCAAAIYAEQDRDRCADDHIRAYFLLINLSPRPNLRHL